MARLSERAERIDTVRRDQILGGIDDEAAQFFPAVIGATSHRRSPSERRSGSENGVICTGAAWCQCGGVVPMAKQMRRDPRRTAPRATTKAMRCSAVLAVGDEVVDHGGVGEGGRITQGAELVFGDLAEDTPHDLAGAGLGQAGRELDEVGRGDRADLLAHPVATSCLAQLVGRRRRPPSG